MRLHDWVFQLDEYLASKARSPFHWNRHDCRTFVIGAIQAVTGRDLSSEFAEYESAIGAQHLVDAAGGLEKATSIALGAQPIHRAFIKRGDIVLGITPESDAFGGTLGVCMGVKFAFVAPVGWTLQPIHVVQCGWSID